MSATNISVADNQVGTASAMHSSPSLPQLTPSDSVPPQPEILHGANASGLSHPAQTHADYASTDYRPAAGGPVTSVTHESRLHHPYRSASQAENSQSAAARNRSRGRAHGHDPNL
ncbi:hypothetical protein BX661DRAFT_189482 [Kickxella alabastrina]|uniref:uncharacterized protein n=1 Tax=Kickxella alabastrina TaxID=61397 RepID=UPI00221FF8E4|nr:uncharacterized protein BX661DRAFT_189482 [Kickxella alabastrina]KAI7820089.1 hypothetical protein BX661DRAFT_189482 [Kickxella alabastrina]